jgi:3-oxoacyl-[acyl-carrier-protein] synthase II
MPAESRRPVISGTATITAVGRTPRECFDRLLAGDTGLGPLVAYPAEQFNVRNAYQVSAWDRTEREHGFASQLLTQVIQAAAQDARLHTLQDIPVIIGTGLGETRTVESAWLHKQELSVGADTLVTAVREETGATDVQVFSNACSASLYALGAGCDLLAQGDHDTVIVAGVDVLSQSMFGLLDRVHPDPPTSLRPFDASRLGVIMGDGAAAVVLRNKVPGLDDVTVGAVALGCDAFHATAPDVDGIEHTIRNAHRIAGTEADAVDAVFAHGTGTVLNDEAEATALSRVLPNTVPVTSVKGATGHTSGGSGLFSVCMAVETISSGRLPGIHGLTQVDAAARGLALSALARDLGKVSIVQVDAFGFGGLNAVAILEGERGRRMSIGSSDGSGDVSPRAGRQTMSAPAKDHPAAVLRGPHGTVNVQAVGLCLPDLGVHDLGTLLAGAAAPIDLFDLRAAIGRKGFRTMTPATRVAVVAADRAVDGIWSPNERQGDIPFHEAGHRRGIVAASAHGNTESVCLTAQAIEDEGVRATSPLQLPNASRNVLAATLAIRHGVTGVCLTMDNGLAGGWDGLRWAVQCIARGRCDEILCVSAEAPSETVLALTGQRLTHGSVALLLGRADQSTEPTHPIEAPPFRPTLAGDHGTLEPGLSIAAAAALGDAATALSGPDGAWEVRTR